MKKKLRDLREVDQIDLRRVLKLITGWRLIPVISSKASSRWRWLNPLSLATRHTRIHRPKNLINIPAQEVLWSSNAKLMKILVCSFRNNQAWSIRACLRWGLKKLKRSKKLSLQ